MRKEKLKEFQLRIVRADKGELLIINYEMLLEEVKEAVEFLENKRLKEFSQSMSIAHKILRELLTSLDFNHDISKELMSIYIYLNKKLIDASLKLQAEDLLEIIKILEILLDGWKMIDGQRGDRLMTNTEEVHYGLTYGKDKKNREIVSSQTNRGLSI